MRGSKVFDIYPLRHVKKLSELNISGLRVFSLEPLSEPPNLTLLITPDGESHFGREAVKAAIKNYEP